MRMFTRNDIKPLSIAAGGACVLGVAMGLFLSLPSDLAHPQRTAEPQLLGALDPNLAKYQEMMAAEGVRPTPYILAAASYPVADVRTQAPKTEFDALDASYAREEAALQDRDTDLRPQRVQWLQARDDDRDAEDRGYASGYRSPDPEPVRWTASPAEAAWTQASRDDEEQATDSYADTDPDARWYPPR